MTRDGKVYLGLPIRDRKSKSRTHRSRTNNFSNINSFSKSESVFLVGNKIQKIVRLGIILIYNKNFWNSGLALRVIQLPKKHTFRFFISLHRTMILDMIGSKIRKNRRIDIHSPKSRLNHRMRRSLNYRIIASGGNHLAKHTLKAKTPLSRLLGKIGPFLIPNLKKHSRHHADLVPRRLKNLSNEIASSRFTIRARHRNNLQFISRKPIFESRRNSNNFIVEKPNRMY